MKRSIRLLALALGALAIEGAGAHAAGAGAAVVLAPHRAIYDLSLERAGPGSGVTDVTGRIVYEITGSACEGYAQNMRFVSVTSNQEGSTQQTDLRTSSWEEVPSRKLRFSTSTYQNEAMTEQSRGMAVREGPGMSGKAELTRPAKKSFDVPADARFPIQHSMELISTARAGKHVLSALLYDGSEGGTKVYDTTALIGTRSGSAAAKMLTQLKEADKLAGVVSWPVSISYFEPGHRHKDEMPLYEMSYRFHENGVTSAILIDYGDYAVKGTLSDLSFLEASTCEPAQP